MLIRKQLGRFKLMKIDFSKKERDKNALYMPDAQAAAQAEEEYLQEKMKELEFPVVALWNV